MRWNLHFYLPCMCMCVFVVCAKVNTLYLVEEEHHIQLILQTQCCSFQLYFGAERYGDNVYHTLFVAFMPLLYLLKMQSFDWVRCCVPYPCYESPVQSKIDTTTAVSNNTFTKNMHVNLQSNGNGSTNIHPFCSIIIISRPKIKTVFWVFEFCVWFLRVTDQYRADDHNPQAANALCAMKKLLQIFVSPYTFPLTGSPKYRW